MGQYLRNEETNAESITINAGEENAETFYKHGEGVHAWEYDNILLVANRPLDDDEMLHAAQMVGYAYARLSGERFGWPDRISENSFALWSDSTKCRNSDFADFADNLNHMLANGSGLRKTNRAGEGTKDTHKVPPMDNVTLDIYLDEVFSFV